MKTEIRQLQKSDTEEMFKLASYAFNKELTVERRERFARLVENSNNYGLMVDGKLASQVMSTPFEVNFHGVTYKMGGIGYVASYPEYRGQGKIHEIMFQILSDMKKEKIALSYLAPFSYRFYRRFGYEQVFENLHYQLSANHLPKVIETTGQVHRMKLKEAEPFLEDLYEKDEKNHKGGVKRAEWWWNYILSKNKMRDYAVYFDDKNQPQGYVSYERNGSTFHIVEWVYLNVEAFKGLGKFILSHASAFETFDYTAPNTEHSLEFLVQEPQGKVAIEPYMMGRIVDLNLFLSQYPYLKVNGNHEFYLEVDDDFAPWNRGIWHLVLNETGTHFEKVAEEISEGNYQGKPLIKGNIQAFTQLFMGYRRPKTLAFYNRIKADEKVLASLEELIPRGLPSLVDYF